jgi:hypothetical protein
VAVFLVQGKGVSGGKKLPSGKRPDAINYDKRNVRELKPDNPRAIRLGQKQVEGYRQELEQDGSTWTSNVDTYQP